jgi:hypothetical protein
MKWHMGGEIIFLLYLQKCLNTKHKQQQLFIMKDFVYYAPTEVVFG